MSPVVLLVFTLTIVNGAPTKESLLPRVIDAVDRAIKFFSSDYSSINVDGLFGLRIGQGQIIEALEECESRSCSPELKDLLRRFRSELEVTCQKAMPYIEQESPDYFARFRETISKPYILKYRPFRFHGMEDVEIGHNKEYDEEEGDRCYARLLGTFQENDRTIPRCNVTQPCLDLVTKGDTKRYTITHQLLYFIVVEHTGCDEKLSEQSSSLSASGIREIEDRFCQKIYKEASILAKEGSVNIGSQDLFLEQSVLCGSLGYENFFKPGYIDMVLKMQAPEGCFTMGFETDSEILATLERLRTSRKLQREQAMKDGCLSHKSGLGFGTLALYLRYLVRSMTI
ncbi:UPF0764 protein C16orf89 homolog isoform X2 [Haliotis rubra]|uniref:UPF0764 protein C16orf89 homolog isoform X1 n=1 Tax=Haliotis rubra TaxID=36100 RepID=UPI001EE62EE5|nr:UPF0764 protein C16orf89 homolog isoform X1 [Haliotis rubra]XP_046576821.1 UPF0764 protein C16orf89 homolog isoform X2 [Haliotis rubra]